VVYVRKSVARSLKKPNAVKVAPAEKKMISILEYFVIVVFEHKIIPIILTKLR
jgi:hypothetical protein